MTTCIAQRVLFLKHILCMMLSLCSKQPIWNSRSIMRLSTVHVIVVLFVSLLEKGHANITSRACNIERALLLSPKLCLTSTICTADLADVFEQSQLGIAVHADSRSWQCVQEAMAKWISQLDIISTWRDRQLIAILLLHGQGISVTLYTQIIMPGP